MRVGNSKLHIACHLENLSSLLHFPTFFYSHDDAVMVQGIKAFFATIEGVLLGRYFDTISPGGQ